MKSSDEIFQLLKTLSKQEKSYFKKFATAFSDEDGSNYIKLFDEISAQASKNDEYDETKIKEGKYKGKFLKNLSFHKNYLHNMILSSLVMYQKDNKGHLLIRNLISQSELLFDKLLYSQSLKVLLRAKKLSIETDNHFFLYDILLKEKIIYKYTLSSEELSEKSKLIFDEEYRTLDILKNNIDYYFLNDCFGKFAGKTGTGFTRSEMETQEMDEFFKNPLLKDIDNAKTFFTRTLFNTMHQQYCSIKNDYERGYYFILENERLWEENVHKVTGKLDNYIFAIFNLMISQARTKRFDEFEQTYNKMKGLEKRFQKQLTDSNRVFIFYSLAIHGITNYIDQLDEKGLEKIDIEIESNLNKYESKIVLQHRIILYYFLGTSSFVRHKFESAIHWMGKIINIEKTDLSEDYQCYSRIVYLISYYELGYFDSMEYVLKSVYHFMSKRKRVYKYEDVILKYLRRSFRLKSKDEVFMMLVDMKRDLEKIREDPFEQNAFDAFNILVWLDSRIKKIKMLEAIEESRKIKQTG